MVIGYYSHLRSPYVTVELFDCPNERQTLFLCNRVISLRLSQQSTGKCDRPFSRVNPLDQCSSDAVIAGIRMDLEWSCIIRVRQPCGFHQRLFQCLETPLRLLSPHPCPLCSHQVMQGFSQYCESIYKSSAHTASPPYCDSSSREP